MPSRKLPILSGARSAQSKDAPAPMQLLILLFLFFAPIPVHAGIPRDIVVMAKHIDDITSLDPAEAYEFSDAEVIGNCYDRLLDYDPAHPARILGALAQSWSVDPDGVTYRFTIRAGARFASGRAVTAEDAAFSLRRTVQLDLTPAFVLDQFGFTKDNVASLIRADHDTLVIKTPIKVAPSLLYYILTSSPTSVVDEETAMAHAENGDLGHHWLQFHSAGSGSYRLGIWRPSERIVLDAVPNAWRGKPKNREVILLDIAEPATQRLMLERGDADYARDLDKDQLADLARDPSIVFDRALQSLETYMALNQRNPYLRRPQVIEAFKYLVDYQGIASGLLGGTRVVHQSFVPDGILGADDATPFAFDLARAKSLLAQAGLGAGFGVSVDVTAASPWLDIAEALQAGFAKAGVRLDIEPGDDKETLTKYRARRHDIYLGEWGSDYPDPHSNAQAFLTNDDMSDAAALKTLAWRNSWADPALAARVEAAEREPDIARRAALYRALEHDEQQVGPYVIMFQDVAVAAHRNTVHGFSLGPGPDHTLYRNIEKN